MNPNDVLWSQLVQAEAEASPPGRRLLSQSTIPHDLRPRWVQYGDSRHVYGDVVVYRDDRDGRCTWTQHGTTYTYPDLDAAKYAVEALSQGAPVSETTRKAKRAARQSLREANRRTRELHPEHVDPIAELPPLHVMQAFASSVAHLPVRDAVDHFLDWLDERIEADLPGDGPMARAGEALLEGLSDMGLKAMAQMFVRSAARVPVMDRRHP